MPTYLLPCSSCGESIRISPSQAGGSVTCVCGASAEAPRLGQLRQLPTLDEQDSAASSWGFRQGVVATCLILAALLGAAGGWLAANELTPPQELNMADYLEVVDQNVDNLTPAQTYDLWTQSYKTLAMAGFVDPNEKITAVRKQMAATQRLYRNGLLIAAGVALVGGIAAGVALPR